MNTIDYFKLQAKNLFKDYKTQTSPSAGVEAEQFYEYSPTYFDIDGIVAAFDLDEDHFSLMNAQHIIAQLAGFYKWTDMIKASDVELELGKLLFDNQHKISTEGWEDYMKGVEWDHKKSYSSEERLEIFRLVFANDEGHQSFVQDFRLNPKKGHSEN